MVKIKYGQHVKNIIQFIIRIYWRLTVELQKLIPNNEGLTTVLQSTLDLYTHELWLNNTLYIT